jgi:DNA-binding CsgD family transcriptional regulator
MTDQPNQAGRLSPREGEVYRLAIQGCTTRKIAEALRIGPGTVKTHLEHIRQKTGEINRSETKVPKPKRERIDDLGFDQMSPVFQQEASKILSFLFGRKVNIG